jgi:plastocyanin
VIDAVEHAAAEDTLSGTLFRSPLAWMLAAALCALAAPPALAAPVAMPGAVPHVKYDGTQTLYYEFGPIAITPGQNTIEFAPTDLKPRVPGYITRFEPNLIRKDGSVPPVDELHLHHGVWLMRNYPTFAAGEEKTIFQFPRGFGYRYDPSDPWIVNYMIHNLLPGKDTVYLTYKVDFVPADAPAAAGLTEVKPLWLDVAGLSAYPVFDVKRGWGGRDGRYTFPDEVATAAERRKVGSAQRVVAPQDMTLVWAGGHLHPGGLSTNLSVKRDNGARRALFKSEARYWEPAGAVSWDVAMTVTDPDWRVKVRRSDELRLSATYDAKRAAWYESMGIDFVFYAEGHDVGGVDPFAERVDTIGDITHGHLPENDNHGGGLSGLPDPRRMLAGPPVGTVGIRDFVYARGDLSGVGRTGRPPVVRAGSSLRFRNTDASQNVWHTITACRAPCNRSTGVAYPLADGPVQFDSGQLGFGPRGLTAAANRDTWRTPRNLKPGTYTFFCRVHPFMRGAFRVKGR